ncbi:MAG: 16S rRNA (cytosine(1402)-N(4))-methyltransferase RsmH [Lachnospiraceae bacterium]|nr:16S rRNA (cytosine(1402)-N(4))-methyltransferase RsmH [Lachnospiraceae bacterium]
MAEKEFYHIPVLLEEVIGGLNIKPDGIYVDGTVGGGGHSSEIAKRLNDEGRLYCFDQDSEALAAAKERLKIYGDRVVFIHDNYVNAVSVLQGMGIEGADGILLDIGVSSYQLDNPERGFSYNADAPLDMRMNRENTLSAYDIVNTYSKNELSRVLREYGEERFADRIASNIVKAREKEAVGTTFELNEIIKASIPAKMLSENGHPSKRTFQALRIECNKELDVLKSSIDGMIDFLRPEGRLLIISFQSLEDRIVKNAFKTAENPCTCPPSFPQCVCGKVSKGRTVTRHPVTASEEELEKNRRSKPAKLRIFERKE